MNRVVFSSVHNEWSTPTDVYDGLNREFSFDFDPCPLGGAVDGRSTLFCEWRGKRAFVNPPYDDIARFLQRWHEPELAVFLIPARTDTRWFHDICLPHAAEIRFIRGRLKFGGAATGAPFPSMVVVFRNGAGETGPAIQSPTRQQEPSDGAQGVKKAGLTTQRESSQTAQPRR